jgi:hypothetical protein
VAQTSTPRVHIQDGGRPLVLTGPPRFVRGEVMVRNPGQEKVIVRQPMMRSVAAATRGKHKTAALPDTAISLRRIVVRAGQDRRVPMTLSLDASTPPGTYHAQLDVDGELRDVVMHVTEDVSFSIEPQTLIIPNRPGQKIQKRIIVSNDGNVAVTVKPLGPIVLDEDLVHCRALRGALADVGQTLKTLDDFVVALGRRYHDLYESLVMKLQNEKTSVEPGATAAIDLTITLPEKLDARFRYTASAPISTQNLSFTIVPE